jgi:hypothetical protein
MTARQGPPGRRAANTWATTLEPHRFAARRSLKGCVIALLITIGILTPTTLAWATTPAAAAPAQAQKATDPSTSTALADLKACLAQKKVGDLVLLIDTSGSLKSGDNGTPGSDPTGVRVDAATLLLTRLTETMAQGAVTLDVSIAGFDSTINSTVGFTPVTPDQLPNLNAQLAAFATKNTGKSTDYWAALNWVNSTLEAKQQSRGEAPACQFAIWFTDGAFDLSATGEIEQPPVPGFETTKMSDVPTAKAVQAAAADELCRVGGPADQMRLDGITMIAVGLGSNAADYAQNTFSLLNYAENPGSVCGAQPGRGLFIPAGSLGELVLAFDALGGSAGGTLQPPPNPLCQLQACPEGTYTFGLDDSLDVVHVVAILDEKGQILSTNGIRVQLAGPDGSPPMVINGTGTPQSGTEKVSGVDVKYQWSQRGALTLDMQHALAQSWAGNWTLTFIDTTGQHPDAVSRVQLTLSSDLQVTVSVADDPWRAGTQSGQITFTPARLDGTPIDPASISTAGWTLTSSLDFVGTSSTATSIPIPMDQLKPTSIPIPEDVTPGQWQVRVSLGLQLAGKPLPDVIRQASVTIAPPLGSPTLTQPAQLLDFGSIQGVATANGTISVTGPNEGDGCAWVTQGPLGKTPPQVTSVTITSTAKDAASCVSVKSGTTTDIPVSLTPGAEGNGPLTGSIDVHLAPISNLAKESASPVNYQATMARLPNQPVKWLVLLVAMLIAILLPLAVLLIARRIVARFPRNVQLQSAILNVQVGENGLRGAGGTPLSPTGHKWTAITEPGSGGHTLNVGGIGLTAHAGWRLTEPGYVEVDGDEAGVCGKHPHQHPTTGRPRLPLAIEGTWTILLPRIAASSNAPDVNGRLMLIIATGASEAAREKLINDAITSAPNLVESLRQGLRNGADDAPPNAPVPVGAAPRRNPFQDATGGDEFDTSGRGPATGFNEGFDDYIPPPRTRGNPPARPTDDGFDAPF